MANLPVYPHTASMRPQAPNSSVPPREPLGPPQPIDHLGEAAMAMVDEALDRLLEDVLCDLNNEPWRAVG